MIVTAEIGCEGGTGTFEDPCPQLKLYPTIKYDGRMASEDERVPIEDIPRALAERMRLKGWVTVDGKHFCPRHTPEKIGNVIQIGDEYAPICEGWEARVPGGARTPEILVEVRRAVGASVGEEG